VAVPAGMDKWQYFMRHGVGHAKTEQR